MKVYDNRIPGGMNNVIYELARNDCERARPIFQCMDYNLAVNSIIEGATPAGIYVDDPVNPKAAITWTKHRFYLAGDAGNNAFNRAVSRLFAEEIYPQFIAAGMYQLVLYYAPDKWEEKMDVILRNKFPLKSRRQFYAISELERDWRALIPAGFTLRRVDRELFADTGLENRHALIEEMQSERPSVEDFMNKSFGFCLVYGDEIVGWCLSEYNSGNRCEVGIETVKAYRRRGIATVTALALVEHALANNITRVGWHCWADNQGSIATARKVSFEKITDYPVYYVRFREKETNGD